MTSAASACGCGSGSGCMCGCCTCRRAKINKAPPTHTPPAHATAPTRIGSLGSHSLVGNLQDIGHHQTVLAPEPLAVLRLQQIFVAEIRQRHKVDEAQRGEEEAALQRDAIGGVGDLPQTAACQSHRANGEGQRKVASASRLLCQLRLSSVLLGR